jgi:hypothetical protein
MIAFGVNTSNENIERVKAIINDDDMIYYKCEFVENEYRIRHIGI